MEKIWALITGFFSPPPSEREESLQYYREFILNIVLRICFVVISIVLVPSVYGALSNDLPEVAVYDILIYIGLVILIFSKKLSHETKSYSFLAFFLFTGIAMQFMLGVYGAGLYYLFVFPVIAAVMLGKWPSILAVCTNTAFVFLFWFLIKFGFYHAPGYETDFDKQAFLLTGINFLAVNILATFPISFVVDRIERSFAIMQQSNKILREQRDLLRKTNSELDEFVYSISHHIRAPLASVMGLIDLATKSGEKENVDLYLGKMSLSTRNLDAFLRQMMDFSANKQKALSDEIVTLNRICDDLVNFEKYYYEELEIETSYNLEINEFRIDSFRLKVILQNLISNAIKYSKPRGRVRLDITSRSVNGEVEISVKDNGVGIREDHKERIFDMFYRAHDFSRGSGLGLYIVRECLSYLKGTIQVESSGEGSTFTIRVPVGH